MRKARDGPQAKRAKVNNSQGTIHGYFGPVKSQQEKPPSVMCPICLVDLTSLALNERTAHVEECLGVDEVAVGGRFESSEVTSTVKTEVLSVKDSAQFDEEIFNEEKESPFIETTGSCSTEELLASFSKREHVELSDEEQDFMEARIQPYQHNQDESALDFTLKVDYSKKGGLFTSATTSATRRPPFYKILNLNNRNVAVDAFCYGPIENVSEYFLTHFHSDHYGGLSKSWNTGLIYCTEATGKLVQMHLKVSPEYIRPCPMNAQISLDGYEALFIDANHCPGSAIILFTCATKKILHTGDFRASTTHVEYLSRFSNGPIDIIYLDTTYLDPTYCFPSQGNVIDCCAEYVGYLKENGSPPSTKLTLRNFNFFSSKKTSSNPLVFVGTYTIGKEKLAIGIAKRLGSKIFAQRRKMTTLRALGDKELDSLLTDDGLACNVHLVGMRELKMEWKPLSKIFTHLIAFVPTGWAHKGSGRRGSLETSIPATAEFRLSELEDCRKIQGNIQLFRVPYSEHSSFRELADFCTNVDVRRIIPTVNESTEDELLVKQMERWEMTMKRVIEKEMRMTVPLERSDEQIDL